MPWPPSSTRSARAPDSASSGLPTLPHRYPFLLTDVATGDPDPRVRVRLTASGTLCRDGRLSPLLLIEIVAQAAAALEADRQGEQGETGSNGSAYMAGVDRLVIDDALAERPLVPGDTLDVRTEPTGGFGRLFKVRGVVTREGLEIAQTELVLMRAG